MINKQGKFVRMGRRPRSPALKMTAVSFSGEQWQEILNALDILTLDTSDKARHREIHRIEDRILKKVRMPSL